MEDKDLKKASPEVLKKALRESEDNIRGLRASLSANQLSQVRKLRVAKKTIAKIKTYLRQGAA
ncbi:MAG: 50S ribosomal protein L29 [Patescibacteria group bacterium]|jgi:ribosomal protein L29